jgi:hypothetical protein
VKAHPAKIDHVKYWNNLKEKKKKVNEINLCTEQNSDMIPVFTKNSKFLIQVKTVVGKTTELKVIFSFVLCYYNKQHHSPLPQQQQQQQQLRHIPLQSLHFHLFTFFLFCFLFCVFEKMMMINNKRDPSFTACSACQSKHSACERIRYVYVLLAREGGGNDEDEEEGDAEVDVDEEVDDENEREEEGGEEG